MRIPKKLIDEINKLARKKRKHGLTEKEQKHQKKLYAEYLGYIRQQVIDRLEYIKNSTADKPQHTHSRSCGCCSCSSNSTDKK